MTEQAEQKAIAVAVPIAAPAPAVWTALRDRATIARWHGWDYDGIAGEIQIIYFDYATEVEPHRLDLADDSGGQRIEVETAGPHAVLRVTRAGDPALPVDQYDVIEEGWRQFFEQLRYLLERRPEGPRRTILLEGDAAPAAIASALPDYQPGAEWHRGRYQLGWASPAGLIVLAAPTPLTSQEPTPLMVTVSTFGLDDPAFAQAQTDWLAWWSALATNPRSTTGPVTAD